MKKTLLITLEYPPMIGGVAHYYENIVRRLPRESMWVLDNEKDELLFKSRFIWPKWLKGLVQSWRAVKKYSIEHILVGQVLPIGTIALILKKIKGIPYTVMTHAMDITVPAAEKGSGRKIWLIKLILKNAKSVTTVSTYTRLQLEQLGVPAKKIVLVFPCPNIVGSELNRSSYDMNELEERYQLCNKKVILSVGRLVQRKGFDMVINALPLLKDDLKDSLYVIVGDGQHRATLEMMAQQNQVEKQVIFTGNISNDELIRWYFRCQMLVMPSRELENKDVEGFGIVYLEANSFGKPVIGGKSGGVTDAVIDGETGFLVDPNDAEMISKAIKQLLTDERQASILGEQGAQRVHEIFQWRAQAKKIERILS